MVMQFSSLDQEDPLEKGMATHSGILAGRIPWTEKGGRVEATEPANSSEKDGFSKKCSPFGFPTCRFFDTSPFLGDARCSAGSLCL